MRVVWAALSVPIPAKNNPIEARVILGEAKVIAIPSMEIAQPIMVIFFLPRLSAKNENITNPPNVQK